MKKASMATFLVAVMISLITSAMASSISESFTGNLYFRFPDGSMQMTSQHIATATHSYLLKNNTQNLYTGATNQGTSCSKGSRTVSTNIRITPNFTCTVTNEGKTITIKFSGGSVAISYHDMIIIDEMGNQTVSSDVATKFPTFNASKVHNK